MMNFFTLLTRNKLCRNFSSTWRHIQELPMQSLDVTSIENNLKIRHHNSKISKIVNLLENLKSNSTAECLQELNAELMKLPNTTHPRIRNYGNDPNEILTYSAKKLGEQATEFSEISKHLNIFRMDHLGNYAGHKSYYLFGKLAELEQALISYSLSFLKKQNFRIIAVPDILPSHIIEGCGMQTQGSRTQVYKLDSENCLSGTSEMALAGFFAGKTFQESELPINVAAVSRCYRAETSSLNEEKGIYRVHQFTKVEMFSICSEKQSQEMIEYFKDTQINIFKNLNISFRLLDMPPTELGDPAYEKYDIESWMPGRKMWGEISSSSNCTDYQAKRLQIQYTESDGTVKYAHTVNGTAAAIPRLLISLVESNQVDANTIQIPEVLHEYISNNTIHKDKSIPEIKLIKYIK